MNERSDYINALLFPESPKWPSNAITYSFLADAGAGWFGNYTPAGLELLNIDYSEVDNYFAPFNDTQKAAATKALNLWAEVADIQFIPKEDVSLQLADLLDLGLVESGLKAIDKWDDFTDAIDKYIGDLIGFPVLDGADIRFGTTNAEIINQPGTSGFAYPPPEGSAAQFNQARQEIANFINGFLAPLDWIGLTPSGLDVLKIFNYKPGVWGDIYLHKQNIDYDRKGLEPLFEDYAPSNFDEGSKAFQTLLHEIGHALGLDHPHEGTKMPEEKDNYHYTLMSYNDSSSEVVAQPSTPMLYDILAIQDLYGANNNTRKGNTTYSWKPNKPFMETIWDAGGKDTISAANQSVDVIINLNEGEFSSIGPKDISQNPDTAVENLAIAFDVTIENAVGGAGNDTLIANDVKNQLKGGPGLDVVSYNFAEKGITLNLTTGRHKGDAKGDTFKSIEQISGSPHADKMTGSPKGDILDGSDGNDVVKGGAGNDTLMPGNGDDTIDGGKGNDVLVLDYSQLQTRAIAWLGEEKKLPEDSWVFVGNAYGVGNPVQIPLIGKQTGFNPSLRGDVVAISEDGLQVAWEQQGSNEGFWMTEIVNPEAPVKIPNVPEDDVSGRDKRLTSFSADLSKVAWLDANRSQYDLYVANTDGTNLVKIPSVFGTSRFSDFRGYVSLSGNGQKVGWVGADENGISQIFLANSDGSKVEQITKTSDFFSMDRSFQGPSLSHNGSILTWHENTSRPRGPDFIWVRNPDGTTERKKEADLIEYTSISEDGSKIFWAGAQQERGDYRISVLNADGSEEVNIVAADPNLALISVRDTRISRDGKTVAFMQYNEKEARTNSLFVTDADGTSTPTYIASSLNENGSSRILYTSALSDYVDMGVRYEKFNAKTGSGQITTWGPSWVNFKSIEQFNLTGTRYDDELYGGNKNDTLIGGGGDDTLKAGNGDDIYQLNPKTAGGSQIEDTGGKDTLELIQTQVNQKKGKINLKEIKISLSDVKRDGDNLLVNLNNNRKIDATEDLSIVNFFDRSQAGTGFIEKVANLKGSNILKKLGTEAQGVTKNGNQRNNILRGSNLDDVLNGKGGNDKLFGNNGDDILTGGVGDDKLNGGKGEDILTGGKGKDSFILDDFNKTETDEITDFILGEDKIILHKSAFKAINSSKGSGFNRKQEFAVVDDAAEVASSKAFIVYNEESGELFYNANGNKAGFGNGGLFAKLERAPGIGATDFMIQP